MLLGEYCLTPEIFAAASYSSEEVCDIRLTHVKEALLSQGLVRDLRDGDWLAHLLDNSGRWHRRGLELVHKLQKQGRLVLAPAALSTPPQQEADWCRESLASDRQQPLTGIVVSDALGDQFTQEALVARIGHLSNSPWWQDRRESVILNRTTGDYLRHLDLVLRHATHLMFIDPHLDPSKRRYARFVELLLACRRAECPPLIQLHRVWYEDSHDQRDRGCDYWRGRFRDLEKPLARVGLSARVFLWDKLQRPDKGHTRYVISNLIGILCGNGFDEDHEACDTWSRLDRKTRDDIQRQLDPASRRGASYSFSIGHAGGTT
ncbi:MAG: hypothetical protein FJ387_03350 [Verrucomicrobia bacterium]|nr:hypothetical protein [Verrucomicrobiota bacterium]